MSEETQPKPNPSRVWPAVLIGLLVAVAGLVTWYLIPRPAPEQLPPGEPAPAPPAAVAQTDEGTLSPQRPPPIPVQEGDARVRELIGRMSQEPELTKWLGVEGLLQRFTTAVSNIADGESPRMVLSFLAPEGGFQVIEIESEEKTLIDPKSYERYDAVARVIGSLNAQAAVPVWRELKPLAEQVYAEIAPPGRRFEQTFARSIDHLLEVPVPEGEVEVVPKGALYAYADPQWEGLSPAQKHLLRMGPRNIQLIQERLRALKGALGLR